MATAKKQSSSNRHPGTSDTPEPKQSSLLQSDSTLISDVHTPVKTASSSQYVRPRRRREPPPDLEIDPAIIANLPKMNFALLLVMLMRERNGRVTLTQADLDAADDERLNVCFALSLDNKALEVFVVSRQSGIIRSPEATAWTYPQSEQINIPATIREAVPYSPSPLPVHQYSPPPPPPDNEEARRMEAQKIVQTWQNLSPEAGGDGASPPPEQGSQAGSRIVEMPGKQPPEKVFPFQVGSSPADAREVPLSQLQSQLLRKDHEIATQEAAAAARVEGSA